MLCMTEVMSWKSISHSKEGHSLLPAHDEGGGESSKVLESWHFPEAPKGQNPSTDDDNPCERRIDRRGDPILSVPALLPRTLK